MRIKADALVWGTLLAACRLHEDVEHMFHSQTSLQRFGEWEEVEETRKPMKGKVVEKESGWSWSSL